MAKQESWTPEQYQAYYQREQQKKNNAPRLKYGNIPVIIDGIHFPSRKEGRFYGKYKLLVKCGELKKIECHVLFPLIVNGILICEYEADFVLYYPDGKMRVIDVKSKATEGLAVFRLKSRLMLAIHKISVEIV